MQSDAAVIAEFIAKKDNSQEGDGDGVWRTIDGRRVFIRSGESPTQAVKRDIKEQGVDGRGGKQKPSTPSQAERIPKQSSSLPTSQGNKEAAKPNQPTHTMESAAQYAKDHNLGASIERLDAKHKQILDAYKGEKYDVINCVLRGTCKGNADRPIFEDSSFDPEYIKGLRAQGKTVVADSLEAVRESHFKDIKDNYPDLFNSRVRPMDAAKLLDEAITEKLPEPVTVYRGFSDSKRQVKEGGIYQDKGFVSTSLVPSLDIIKDAKVIAEIRVPAGARALYMDSFSKMKDTEERELLFPRDSKFKVISVAKEGKTKRVVMELMA